LSVLFVPRKHSLDALLSRHLSRRRPIATYSQKTDGLLGAEIVRHKPHYYLGRARQRSASNSWMVDAKSQPVENAI
jgi:hypothetical protein